jgi:hypothetical protein
MKIATEDLRWERSTFCANGTCGEVATSGDDVYLRSSERPAEIIRLTSDEWAALKAGIQNGEF